jgi:predicted helicase
MMQANLGLISTRFIFRKEQGFHHAFVTSNILDINQIQSPGTAQLFPLYLYSGADKKDLFSHTEGSKKREPNISPEIFKALSEVYKKEPVPEEIFYYIYAVLYSNVYRAKYAEFLKMDFPRIPFTKDYKLFGKMAENGERLVDLHLLKSAELDEPAAKFHGEGDNGVEQLKYEKEKVNINTSQYFEGIKKEVWEYQIGGYQVCNKWLKDRKGKRLSLDEIKHYCRIVTSLQKTIEIQKAIDDIYPEAEK